MANPAAVRRGQLPFVSSTSMTKGPSGRSRPVISPEAAARDYGVVVEMNVVHTLFATDDVVILTEIAEPTKAIKLMGRRDRGITDHSGRIGRGMLTHRRPPFRSSSLARSAHPQPRRG